MSGSIKRDFSAGVTSMSLAIWIEQAILFLMFVVYARHLGAETVGVAMMAITVVLFGETLVHETTLNPADRRMMLTCSRHG
jgi:O-antigen/teichoic acid export membrane protein